MTMLIKTETFAKLFFLISLTGLSTYIILAFYSFHSSNIVVPDDDTDQTDGLNFLLRADGVDTSEELKYILVWTSEVSKDNPFGLGQAPFVDNNCTRKNCYMTADKDFLQHYNKTFDAVLMDVGFVRKWRPKFIPKTKLAHQKYVFHSMKSSFETPICSINTDDYFNWTWTYKLNSDIVSPFVEVTDLEGNFVAPKTNVEWINTTKSLTEIQLNKLRTKRKAVAMIMHSCVASPRNVFAKRLQKALKEFNLELDAYGCSMICPINCMNLIESDYYFYLAHEINDADDYVSDEVFYAYDNYAVPIVKGGADYSRFLPKNSYINAATVSAEELASVIEYTIRNPSLYHSYHHWRNYYTINKVNRGKGLCALCEMLNNKQISEKHTSYKDFRKWWYQGLLKNKCYPKGAQNVSEVLSYVIKGDHTNRIVDSGDIHID